MEAPDGVLVIRRARRRGRVTWADRLVVYVIVGTALVLMLAVAGLGGEGATVLIRGAAGFEVAVPLDTEHTVEVPGPLGTTVVEVADGRASVVESPCPGKLCIAMGRIDKPGRSVVCIPNEVVVAIEGRSGRADAVTR
jgi:hypothetical protein